MKMPERLRYIRADQVAECYSGISQSTYAALWRITIEVCKGTTENEWPEPDAPPNRMEEVWDKLTEEQQREVSAARYE